MADPISNGSGDKLFGLHADAMRLQARRLELISSNIANADTPGFRAKALNFEAALAEIAARDPAQPAATPEQNIGDNHVNFRTALQPSVDGNSVDVSMEQADFADASLRYQVSMKMLEGRMRSLISALRLE
ncbi:MAG: flagellar basal body rod protein FlgB [Nevskiales bacterium]